MKYHVSQREIYTSQLCFSLKHNLYDIIFHGFHEDLNDLKYLFYYIS